MKQRHPYRHVLMTADAVGGVWTYAAALAQGLTRRGWSVTIVTLGPQPRKDQVEPLLDDPSIRIECTDLELEWQDPEGKDHQRALEHLTALGRQLNPDIVHINGYRETLAEWRAPVLAVAHSCVRSWWIACHGCEPQDRKWSRYGELVKAGLDAADRWVAPTKAFRQRINSLYAPVRTGEVIWNGISLEQPVSGKEPFILASGRLWDAGKNIGILSGIAANLEWPVRIAGATLSEAPGAELGAGVEWLGECPRDQLLSEMSRAGIYAAPSVYEPFGLGVLEAAANGCALVLSNIPAFRELWDGAACFVRPRDQAALRHVLDALARNETRRRHLQEAAFQRAARYSLPQQVTAYERLYAEVLDERLSGVNAASYEMEQTL